MSMSLLKEPAYIQQVCTMMGTSPIQDQAARLIMTHVEMRLREVVFTAIKNSQMLNKSRISAEDIDISIGEQAYEEFEWNQPLVGFHPENLEGWDASQGKGDPLFFTNKVVSIDDKVHELMKQIAKPEEKIFIDWIQLENQIPKSASNSNVVLAKRKPESAPADGPPSAQNYKKRIVQGILIKEPERNQQTKEFEEFLESYSSLMSEQVELIDMGKCKFGFTKFKNRILFCLH
jgi:TATA box binding protein associated factor (TAF)